MARSRLASWWIVWTMAIVGIVLGAIGAAYNVNMGEHSSVSPPVRDCLPLLMVLYFASWPGWIAMMVLDVLDGAASGTSFPWLPFLLGQAAGFALLGVFLHWASLACSFAVCRWQEFVASPRDRSEDPS